MKVAIARYIRCPDNYFFDIFDAVTAGTLKKAGHNAVVAERICSTEFTEEEMLQGFVSFLDAFAPELVFLPYLPAQDVARLIVETTGARIVSFGSQLMLESPYVDFVIAEPDPLSCVELVEALSGERELESVGGLWWMADGEVLSSKTSLHPMYDIFTRGTIGYDAFVRLGPCRPVEIRKHIAGDWGCTYRKALSEQSSVSPLCPPYVPAGGCSFCSRPKSHPLEWDRKQEILSEQLDRVLETFPGLRKLIVIDEYALSFVDELALLLRSRPLAGVEVLISGRLTHIGRHRERLESALSTLEGRNRIKLYQFGIENLSDSVLKRYNKGMSFADIGKACSLILELVEEYPNLDVEKSFGFIAFDPWTTTDELRQNVERAALIDLPRFRDQAPFTSLRLQPEVPLYWKAQEDGLLTGRIDDNDFGYSVNSGWRFKHGETARVYEELTRLSGSGLPWPLLGRVLSRL